MPRVKHTYNYFYKITNNLNNHFYYGVHSTDNLDDGYMGSGTRLHYAYKKYGIENFTKEILKFFDTREKANEYEAEIVNEDLIKDVNCYNLIKGGGFDITGMAVMRDKDGKISLIFKDVPRYLSGELVGATKGRVSVKDKDGNTLSVSVDDPRYLSGELVPITKGWVTVKDKDGKSFMVSVDDPRYLSGELVGATKGRIVVKDKIGNMFMINRDDPMYLSGELTGVTKGRILVKDKYNHYYMVSKDDYRYLSGELVPIWTNKTHSKETLQKMRETHKKNHHQQGEKNSQYGTCWIHNDKQSIKIKKDELEQYLNNGWIKGRKMKF